MNDLTENQLRAMLKPGVTLASIPTVLLRKIKRIPGLLQGTEETKRFLAETPTFTMAQCNFFRSCVDAMVTPKQRGFASFEEYGMSDPKGPKWSGHLCKVKDQVKDFLPIPHAPEVKQEDKADLWAASVASMMCTLSSTEDVEVMCPPTVAAGPLSKLVTPLSLSSYELEVPTLLQGKVGVDRHEEKFAEGVYNAVASMSVDDKNRMVNATYTLMAGLAIKQTSNGASSSKDFEMDWKQKPRKKFPLGVPKTIKTKITFIPRTVKIGKQTSTVMLNHYLQSFPPKLLQYFGFFGNPTKTQQSYMRMRPYFSVAMPLDPKEGLKKWMNANGDDFYDSTDLEAPQSDKISLVKKDYSSVSRPTGKALYYGQVAFDPEFFSKYTIVMYHPPHKNQLFYVHNKFSACIDTLPPVWKSFNQKRISNDIQFTEALNSYSSLLCVCFMRGTYNPRPQQYEDLRYPLPKAGEYMELEPTKLSEDIVAHAAREELQDVSSNTFVFGEEEEEDEGEEVSEDVPPGSEEEETGWDEENYKIEEFSDIPVYALSSPFFVPLEDYECDVKKSDRRFEVGNSFFIEWQGERHVVCGLGKMDEEIVNVMLSRVPKARINVPPRSSRSSTNDKVIPKPPKKILSQHIEETDGEEAIEFNEYV